MSQHSFPHRAVALLQSENRHGSKGAQSCREILILLFLLEELRIANAYHSVSTRRPDPQRLFAVAQRNNATLIKFLKNFVSKLESIRRTVEKRLQIVHIHSPENIMYWF